MDNHIFRSAALGFNRQDVMEYIEKVQRDAESKVSWLTAQMDAARQESEASGQALEECTRERDQLRQEMDQLRQEMADLQEQFEAEKDARNAAESDAARQKVRLQDVEAENSLLAEQVQELESRTEGLRHEKERLTQLELDARSRSDELLAQSQSQVDAILAEAQIRGAEIENQAKVRSEALLAEAQKQIRASVEKCAKMLRSCESVAAHVSSELRKMDGTVAQLPVGMNQLKRELAELIGSEPEQES